MGNRFDALAVPHEQNVPGDPLAAYVEAYENYLAGRGHAAKYVQSCIRGIAHLSWWMRHRGWLVSQFDEGLISLFLDGHLPSCTCPHAFCDRRSLRAAMNHLLVVLRAAGAVGPKSLGETPVQEELRRYEKHMAQVRGLAPKTRAAALRVVGRLLSSCFDDGVVDFKSIKAEDVRCFYAQQAKLYSKPVTAGTVVASLRGYFRWRATLGDEVHALTGALSYPANWQLASLPQTLTPEEVEQLVNSLGGKDATRCRDDAMVRCALDLGLRSAEIAGLRLDDIDWQVGTITLRRTKGRRDDVMPLPASTGQAIANYLWHERPKTLHRMLFARRLAPCEQLIGPDLVRKTIRQAFARAGLPYTRSHLLRHTMANRLLASGSSLKEVADVLRHRSLATTMIYAKLDSRSLVEVALPWPGSGS
jgi:site-specific recombinase XerD